MGPAETIAEALKAHQPNKGQYAAVTAGDVVKVAAAVAVHDEVTLALLKGASAVGPGKEVHQLVDDLAHLLKVAG